MDYIKHALLLLQFILDIPVTVASLKPDLFSTEMYVCHNLLNMPLPGRAIAACSFTLLNSQSQGLSLLRGVAAGGVAGLPSAGAFSCWDCCICSWK